MARTHAGDDAVERQVERERRDRTLARAVWEVQEQERLRVARELRDGLGQTLTALKIRLEGLGGRAAASAPELSIELARTVDLASQALEEARRLAHLLRPQMLDELGLGAALRWLARTLGECAGFGVTLDFGCDCKERLDPEIETLAFRVVQEGLTNSLKHSGCGGATVRVARPGGRLCLEIADRGRGFHPAAVLDGSEAPAGFGLRGMRDRVELAGGRFSLQAAPGAGTRLVAELPVTVAAREAPSRDDDTGAGRALE